VDSRNAEELLVLADVVLVLDSGEIHVFRAREEPAAGAEEDHEA
jgi:hypothetical protein